MLTGHEILKGEDFNNENLKHFTPLLKTGDGPSDSYGSCSIIYTVLYEKFLGSLEIFGVIIECSEVVPVLLLTEHHAMKAYWGSGGIAPLIL
jgi:hypothetical protein